MGYEKLLEPLNDMRELCEALLGGAFGRLTGDAREDVKQIYAGTGGLYALFVDIITAIGIENTARRAFLLNKFQELLALMTDNSQALLAELDGPLSEEQTVSVQFLQATSQQLQTHIANIWLYSQLHLNMIKPAPQPVNLAQIARSLNKPPVERAIHTTLFADDEPALIHSDEALLRRCLQELVDNAAKFSSDSILIIHCRWPAGRPVVDVIDTGKGVRAQAAARLFEPFYQEDTNADGIGLGLTIANQIALLLRGKIEVTASRSGIGSTFSLFLPAA